jgi:hypothetical protein
MFTFQAVWNDTFQLITFPRESIWEKGEEASRAASYSSPVWFIEAVMTSMYWLERTKFEPARATHSSALFGPLPGA